MKTIVQNSTKLSKYLFDDSAVVSMGSTLIDWYTENGITGQSLVGNRTETRLQIP